MKTIDLNKSIHDLTTQYPELISIMKQLGFIEITNPVSLNTVGRLMTIPKGSAMKNIPMDEIRSKLQENGFSVKD